MYMDWKLEKLMLDLILTLQTELESVPMHRSQILGGLHKQVRLCKRRGHWSEIETQTVTRYRWYRSVGLSLEKCEKAAAYYALHLLSHCAKEDKAPILLQRSLASALYNGRDLTVIAT